MGLIWINSVSKNPSESTDNASFDSVFEISFAKNTVGLSNFSKSRKIFKSDIWKKNNHWPKSDFSPKGAEH